MSDKCEPCDIGEDAIRYSLSFQYNDNSHGGASFKLERVLKEIWNIILSFLRPGDHMKLTRVCRGFLYLVSTSESSAKEISYIHPFSKRILEFSVGQFQDWPTAKHLQNLAIRDGRIYGNPVDYQDLKRGLQAFQKLRSLILVGICIFDSDLVSISTELQNLELYVCKNLTEDGFTVLQDRMITRLVIDQCAGISRLPSTLPRRLISLRLQSDSNLLGEIDDVLNIPSTVVKLDVDFQCTIDNKVFSHLPKSITELTLRFFDGDHTQVERRELPALRETLKSLKFYDMNINIESLAKLSNLTTLDMSGCTFLTDSSLSVLTCLTNLECLSLENCKMPELTDNVLEFIPKTLKKFSCFSDITEQGLKKLPTSLTQLQLKNRTNTVMGGLRDNILPRLVDLTCTFTDQTWPLYPLQNTITKLTIKHKVPQIEPDLNIYGNPFRGMPTGIRSFSLIGYRIGDLDKVLPHSATWNYSGFPDTLEDICIIYARPCNVGPMLYRILPPSIKDVCILVNNNNPDRELISTETLAHLTSLTKLTTRLSDFAEGALDDLRERRPEVVFNLQ